MDKIYPFFYHGQHQCQAAVLSCIDFRFWRYIVSYIENELGITDFDFPSLPGAAKAINNDLGDLAISCVSIPYELHQAETLIIVNHADCGAYGGAAKHASPEAEMAFHAEELNKAKDKILAKHPDWRVILLFARLVDEVYLEIINIDKRAS